MTDAELEALLSEGAALLNAELYEDEERSRYYLEVAFADGRKQRVYLFLGHGSPHYRHLGPDQRIVYASSYVGEMKPGVDAAALLRKNSQSSLAMVSVFFGEEGFGETIYTSAGLPLRVATPQALAALIDETAGMADALEEELFGVDEH